MPESVAPETRRRGWRPAGPRNLSWFLAAAALLHLPLTPLGALLGLLSLLHLGHREPPPDTLNAIPVSLLSADELAALGMGTPSPPEAPPQAEEPKAQDDGPGEPAPSPPKPKPKPKPKPVVHQEDGGVPQAADAGAKPLHHQDAGPRPLASNDVHHGDAGSGAVASASAPTGSEPLALAGKAASVADPNANVRLLLLNDRIRGLPIAPRIGQLVARLPQWRSFFGPAGLDPIRDIKGMYVAGPQFRVSSEVVAVLAYNVSQSAMRHAVDGLVNREPKGEWLPGPLPVARARADRADRIFVLPKSKILLMVPPHLMGDAVSKARELTFPSIGGDAAVVAFIAKPWRALMGLRLAVDLPHTIASASISIVPASDGGATVRVDAVDESPEAAKSDATTLTSAVNALTQQNVGAIGALLFGGQTLSLIEPIELHAVGKNIRGEARVTPRQLERLLAFAEGWVDSISGPAPPPVGSSGALEPSPSRRSRRPAPAAASSSR